MNPARAAALGIAALTITALTGCATTPSRSDIAAAGAAAIESMRPDIARPTTSTPTTTASTAAPVTNSAVGDGFWFRGAGTGQMIMLSSEWTTNSLGGDTSSWLVLDVEVTVDTGSVWMSEGDWKIRDGLNQSWPCYGGGMVAEPALPTATVAGPDKVRGKVACKIDRGAVTAVWDPMSLDPMRWNIPA